MNPIKTIVAGALVAASMILSIATPASAEIVVIRHDHGWHRDWHRHDWHRHGFYRPFHRDFHR